MHLEDFGGEEADGVEGGGSGEGAHEVAGRGGCLLDDIGGCPGLEHGASGQNSNGCGAHACVDYREVFQLDCSDAVGDYSDDVVWSRLFIWEDHLVDFVDHADAVLSEQDGRLPCQPSGNSLQGNYRKWSFHGDDQLMYNALVCLVFLSHIPF